jgi:hypothetical protein
MWEFNTVSPRHGLAQVCQHLAYFRFGDPEEMWEEKMEHPEKAHFNNNALYSRLWDILDGVGQGEQFPAHQIQAINLDPIRYTGQAIFANDVDHFLEELEANVVD